MCPTSPKAEYFKMGCNMPKYVVNHSLFLRKEFITITFDECLNKIVQQSEMNVFVCFWGIDRHKVSSLFCDSRFLGHTIHLNVLFSLEDLVKKIDSTWMIQVSINVPNTYLNVLVEYQKISVEGELPQFTDIRTLTSTHSMVYLRQELQKVVGISRNFRKVHTKSFVILQLEGGIISTSLDVANLLCHLWPPSGFKTVVYHMDWLNYRIMSRKYMIPGKVLQNPKDLRAKVMKMWHQWSSDFSKIEILFFFFFFLLLASWSHIYV